MRDRVASELTAHTDRTLIDLAALDRDMISTKMRGYAIDTGEYRANIYSLGAAITLPGNEVVGALGISVRDVNLKDGDIDRFGALIKHAAGAISQILSRL